MGLTDDSLTDIGQGKGKTTNFWVRYENTLADQANVKNNANSLLAAIENEFTVTTGWFGTPSGKFGTAHRQEVRLDQVSANLWRPWCSAVATAETRSPQCSRGG